MTIRYLPLLSTLMLAACANIPPASSSGGSALAGHDWRLVELNGQPVADSDRPAHIAFSEADHRISGSGGCNSFGGNYEEQPGNRIHFSQIIHTMMACVNGMDTENAFMDVLNRTDNYSLNGDTLTLNKARMAPLAVFKAD